jgi:hypothetical protein
MVEVDRGVNRRPPIQAKKECEIAGQENIFDLRA